MVAIITPRAHPAPKLRTLRDGSTVRLRPLEANDVERLRRLFFRLSPHTVYLRFFQPIAEPRMATLQHLASVDHDARDAIAAVDDDGEIVAVARYDRAKDDPTCAEVAVVVEDAWQGRGLGHVVLTELAKVAWARGITAFSATVLGENRRMMLLAKSINPDTSYHLDHGEWELRIPLLAA